MWKVFLSTVLFALPYVVSAAGLVPCGGPGEPECQTCHFVGLIDSLAGWLVLIMGIIAAILIVISGFRLVTSAGDVSAMTSAKKTITSLLIGYVIVLGGWLMVDTVLKTLLTNGTWNTLSCVAQPVAQQWSRTTASGDNSTVLPAGDINNRVNSIVNSGALQTDIANAAAAAGITDPNQVKLLKGLISQESSNCTNKVGPSTNSGIAYGCGQMLVSTARTLDPSLKGLTDAQVADKLQNDNAYNLSVSAKYFNQLINKYAGDSDLALAAYNGGPGANLASADCPGLRRWQCVWNSPGCYGTAKTNCTPNTGFSSYEQTRNYVANIKAIATKI